MSNTPPNALPHILAMDAWPAALRILFLVAILGLVFAAILWRAHLTAAPKSIESTTLHPRALWAWISDKSNKAILIQNSSPHITASINKHAGNSK